MCRKSRWHGQILQRLLVLPRSRTWFLRTICLIQRRNDFSYKVGGNREFTSWVVAATSALNECCKQPGWCVQWDVQQIYPVGRCASVFWLSLFGLHRFGCFQHPTQLNVERFKRICTVRIANEQTASGVSIPFVFRGNCAWRDTPLSPCNSCHWKKILALEMSNKDVMVAEEFPASY